MQELVKSIAKKWQGASAAMLTMQAAAGQLGTMQHAAHTMLCTSRHCIVLIEHSQQTDRANMDRAPTAQNQAACRSLLA